MSVTGFVKILEVKRYSENTIASYAAVINMAIHHFNTDLCQLSETQLHEFFYYMVHHKRASYSYQKQIAMALKLYYSDVCRRSIHLEFLMPQRKPEKLPVILSVEEIKRLIGSLSNVKHRCMIALAYSAGLRIGELINMKINDIDSSRMVIHIKEAKGKKDRVVPLSEKLLVMMREYYKEYKPKDYLFEGQTGGAYSNTSFNKVLQKAAKRVGIVKKFSSHALRHSYATHLLEKGTDIRVIQKLLGHNSIKTTMLYTQVATSSLLNVKSPFDDE